MFRLLPDFGHVKSHPRANAGGTSAQYPCNPLSERGKVRARINAPNGADFFNENVLGEAGFEVYYSNTCL
jgi:hypothetical protein